MSKNIVLIGLMGSGKTTVGKNIAKILNTEFADTDKLIINKLNKPIKQIFAEKGELFFRSIESEIINELSDKENLVISTGGGSVIREENIKNLQKNAVLFYLYAPSEELFKRIKNSEERPLIKTINPIETLKLLLEQREKFYNQADYKINTCNKTPKEIAEEIISIFYSKANY